MSKAPANFTAMKNRQTVKFGNLSHIGFGHLVNDNNFFPLATIIICQSVWD